MVNEATPTRGEVEADVALMVGEQYEFMQSLTVRVSRRYYHFYWHSRGMIGTEEYQQLEAALEEIERRASAPQPPPGREITGEDVRGAFRVKCVADRDGRRLVRLEPPDFEATAAVLNAIGARVTEGER